MALRRGYETRGAPVFGLGLINPPPIRVEFTNFDGSLGQLFTCVRERKIDLAGVPLLPICEAYFRYLMSHGTPDLDESAAALAALSYLLERKAWLLLPLPETVEVEDEMLAIGEASVHEFFDAISFLRTNHETRSLLFFRASNQGPHPYEIPYQLDQLNVLALADALQAALVTIEPSVPEPVTREGRSLVAEMKAVLLKITRGWQSFAGLLREHSTKEDAIYVFLSLLELMRLGQVCARVEESEVFFIQA